MSSILKALKRIEVQSSRSDSFFSMPKTSDTKQANNSKARRRWFSPSLMTVSMVLLVIAIAAIILFSRHQPIVTKKFPTGVSGNQKENPASLLENSNIFRVKIPPRSKNLAESPPKKAQLAKNQMKSTAPPGNVKEMPAKARSQMPKLPVDQQNAKPTSTARSPQPGTTATLKNSQQKKLTPKDSAASARRKMGRI